MEVSQTPDIPKECRSCLVAESIFRVCNLAAVDFMDAEGVNDGLQHDAYRKHAAAVMALQDMEQRCPGRFDNGCSWKHDGYAHRPNNGAHGTVETGRERKYYTIFGDEK